MLPEKTSLKEFIGDYTLLISLVVFGALANALHAVAQMRKAGEDSDLIDFFISFIVAGFSGVIFGISSSLVWDDPNMVYACAGAGSFMGVKGLNRLTEVLLDSVARKK